MDINPGVYERQPYQTFLAHKRQIRADTSLAGPTNNAPLVEAQTAELKDLEHYADSATIGDAKRRATRDLGRAVPEIVDIGAEWVYHEDFQDQQFSKQIMRPFVMVVGSVVLGAIAAAPVAVVEGILPGPGFGNALKTLVTATGLTAAGQGAAADQKRRILEGNRRGERVLKQIEQARPDYEERVLLPQIEAEAAQFHTSSSPFLTSATAVPVDSLKQQFESPLLTAMTKTDYDSMIF